MSFTGAVQKVKMAAKTVWDVDHEDPADRIQQRRERIQRRIEAAKRMKKLISIQKMMGVAKEEEELKEFVKNATAAGEIKLFNIERSGEENVTNIKLSADFNQGRSRGKMGSLV